jgi:hypothetical protein
MKKLLLFLFFSTVCFAQSSITASNTVVPYGTPVIDVRGAGAICDGSHNDTSAIAAAAVLAGTNKGILYIPDTGHACLTTLAVILPYNAWLEVEGTLKATAVMTAVVIVGDSTHVAAGKAIYGHGTIDPNALASRGIFVRQYSHYTVQDVTLTNAAIAAIEWGDNTISGYTAYEGTTLNTNILLPSTAAKTNGSIGIYAVGSDSVGINNTIIGYDIGISDSGGGAWTNNHVWGYTVNAPSTCFLSRGGSIWTGNSADTCTQYGYHLAGSMNQVHGGRILSNPSFSSSSFVGIQFDLAMPQSTVTNVNFMGGSSSNPMSVAIGGATSGLQMTGNQCGSYVTSCNAVTGYGDIVARITPLTGQGSVVGPVGFFTSPADGYYKVCAEVTTTQAATTSSTTPTVQVAYPNVFTGGTAYNLIVFGNTFNYVGNDSSGCAPIYLKSSGTISYQTTGYITSGLTPLQYALAVWVESANANGR